MAALVLQLAEEGKLSLNDTVEQWKPGLIAAGDKITIENLLSHRSGIYDVTNAPHSTYDPGTDLTDANLRELLDHPAHRPARHHNLPLLQRELLGSWARSSKQQPPTRWRASCSSGSRAGGHGATTAQSGDQPRPRT